MGKVSLPRLLVNGGGINSPQSTIFLSFCLPLCWVTQLHAVSIFLFTYLFVSLPSGLHCCPMGRWRLPTSAGGTPPATPAWPRTSLGRQARREGCWSPVRANIFYCFAATEEGIFFSLSHRLHFSSCSGQAGADGFLESTPLINGTNWNAARTPASSSAKCYFLSDTAGAGRQWSPWNLKQLKKNTTKKSSLQRITNVAHSTFISVFCFVVMFFPLCIVSHHPAHFYRCCWCQRLAGYLHKWLISLNDVCIKLHGETNKT